MNKKANKKDNSKVAKEVESSSSLKKKVSESENKILRNLFIIVGIVVIMGVAYYFYAQTQTKVDYKGIQFEASKIGEVLFYETVTLTNNSEGSPFGFRLRTNPNYLKNIPFEGLTTFRLMKVNGYTYSGEDFNCEGDGIIAMANLARVFDEMGMTFVRDDNSTCDPEGKYNYFSLKYGNETAIKEVGNHCYDIVIKGNDTKCEILPATEKLMVEMYSRYLNLGK